MKIYFYLKSFLILKVSDPKYGLEEKKAFTLHCWKMTKGERKDSKAPLQAQS